MAVLPRRDPRQKLEALDYSLAPVAGRKRLRRLNLLGTRNRRYRRLAVGKQASPATAAKERLVFESS
jgi:hypothetical protein